MFHLFPVLVNAQRDFQGYLLKNRIKTQVHYPILPYAAKCYKEQGMNGVNFLMLHILPTMR